MPSNRSNPSSPGALATMARWLLRASLAIVGFFMMAGLLLLGLVLAVALVLWSLLRGRRPAAGVLHESFQRARRHRPVPAGPIIDIEAREVPDAASPPRQPAADA